VDNGYRGPSCLATETVGPAMVRSRMRLRCSSPKAAIIVKKNFPWARETSGLGRAAYRSAWTVVAVWT